MSLLVSDYPRISIIGLRVRYVAIIEPQALPVHLLFAFPHSLPCVPPLVETPAFVSAPAQVCSSLRRIHHQQIHVYLWNMRRQSCSIPMQHNRFSNGYIVHHVVGQFLACCTTTRLRFAVYILGKDVKRNSLFAHTL